MGLYSESPSLQANALCTFVCCCLANTCVHLERVIYLHWLMYKELLQMFSHYGCTYPGLS